jgi:DNA-binding PadR family transcriptional regulator
MISKNENKMPSLLRHFFLGFVKIHILHHAAQEPVFGLALIRELGRHGYELSPGTLYPVLHELERAGYVQREDRVVEGKVRKYYRATPSGLEALADARAKIQELVVEVLHQQGPRHLLERDPPQA